MSPGLKVREAGVLCSGIAVIVGDWVTVGETGVRVGRMSVIVGFGDVADARVCSVLVHPLIKNTKITKDIIIFRIMIFLLALNSQPKKRILIIRSLVVVSP